MHYFKVRGRFWRPRWPGAAYAFGLPVTWVVGSVLIAGGIPADGDRFRWLLAGSNVVVMGWMMNAVRTFVVARPDKLVVSTPFGRRFMPRDAIEMKSEIGFSRHHFSSPFHEVLFRDASRWGNPSLIYPPIRLGRFQFGGDREAFAAELRGEFDEMDPSAEYYSIRCDDLWRLSGRMVAVWTAPAMLVVGGLVGLLGPDSRIGFGHRAAASGLALVAVRWCLAVSRAVVAIRPTGLWADGWGTREWVRLEASDEVSLARGLVKISSPGATGDSGRTARSWLTLCLGPAGRSALVDSIESVRASAEARAEGGAASATDGPDGD